jgi:glycosyltransferase involved in cell wall biosynthesis/protein-tyrosine-phosphatase
MSTRGSCRPIRVCHIMSADLWAGAEIQLATLASYLTERPEIELTCALFTEGLLAQELRRLRIQTTVIDEQRNGPVQIVNRLVRLLRHDHIDLVHTHRYKDTILGSIAAKLAGVRHLVRTVHGSSEPLNGWPHARFRCYEAMEKAALNVSADRIITVSKQIAHALAHAGYKRSALTCIQNGIDLSRVKATRSREQVRKELGFDPQTLVIGTVGRLSAVKAQACLLRSARPILESNPAARFVIVGEGPLENGLRALAVQLGIDRECLFLGARLDIFDLVGAMDIFALTSLSEGIPMALLEAMALGRPVVATDVGGIPEIITDCETGLLVAPGDEHALARACIELARDPERARTLAVRARMRIEADFSHERNGERMLDLYRAVFPNTSNTPMPMLNTEPSSDVRSSSAPDIAAAGLLRFSWTLANAFVTYGRRRAFTAIEMWKAAHRMRRLRRNPAILTRALCSARTILVVCQGNIIRSPFAARLVAQAVGNRRHLSIRSGGLAAVPGKPSHPIAVLTASKQHIDLTGHAAAPLDGNIVRASDVIFVMDVPQLLALRQRFPEAEDRTFLLTCLASDTPLEIQDPYDGDIARFETCFDHISRAIRPIVQTLSNTAA